MKKLKAGSLQLVTFIVVVIALLLASFIILIHVHKQFRIKTNHLIETVRLADQGTHYVLNKETIDNDTVSIPLNDEPYKSLSIHKSFWGTFEKVLSKAKIKNTTLFYGVMNKLFLKCKLILPQKIHIWKYRTVQIVS